MKILRWIAVIGWMMVIFLVSSLPGSTIPPIFPLQDIAGHFIIYTILAILFARALKISIPNVKASRLYFWIIVFGIFYGLTDEIHQYFVPGRCMDIKDVLIDGLGTVLGSIIYR